MAERQAPSPLRGLPFPNDWCGSTWEKRKPFLTSELGGKMIKRSVLVVLVSLFAVHSGSVENKKFGDFFSPAGKVTLQDPHLKFVDLHAVAVSRSGRIVGIYKSADEPHGFLKLFTSDGRLERTVDALERQPYRRYAKYVSFAKGSLYDVAVTDQGEIVVAASFQTVFYDTLGRFLRLSNLGRVAIENDKIVHKRRDDPRRLDIGPDGQIAGTLNGYNSDFYLQTYDRNGKPLKRFFPANSKDREMNTAIPNDLDVDSLGDIWCTFERRHKVFHYGMDGTPKNDIVGKSPLYKPPDRIKDPEALKERLLWYQTWTEVVSCAVTQSGYVILIMTAGEQGKSLMPTYAPDTPPYPAYPYPGGLFLDIYDREGNTIVTGLHTPHRFLTVDKQDNLWFDLRPQTPENPAKGGPVVLGKFKLKLPPVAAKAVVSTGRK
jgi:hypothetical protein